MTNLPLLPGAVYDTYGANTSSTLGTLVSNTGSYVQIAASTTRAYDALLVQLTSNSGNSDCALTLAIGAAASEQPIATLKLSATNNSGDYAQTNYLLPISVPAGERLAIKNVSTFQSVTALITGISGGLLADHGCSYAETVGIASGSGTLVDPGATANTLGSWAQLTASSAHNYSYITVVAGGNGSSDRGSNILWMVDIGIGASGSEQILIQQLFFNANGSTNWGLPFIPTAGPFPVSIPAGTRIVARCQSTDITLGTRELDVGLIGFVR